MEAVTRLADPNDLNFILNSFLRSMRSYPEFQLVPNEIYYPEQKKVLERYMRANRPLVLCNSEFPDQIFGYIIGEKNLSIQFIYVKYTYRRFGFAKRLAAELHPDLGEKTIETPYACRNWSAVSTKFKLVHNPFGA
jgi:hypothetical protein